MHLTALDPNRFRFARFPVLILSWLAFSLPALAQDVAGHWEGEIEVPNQALGVVIDLEQSGDGSWSGTFGIPTQGVKSMALEGIEVEGSSVTFAMSGIPGKPTFKGTLVDQEIKGTFSQGGANLPFVLSREAMAGPNRPQEPKPPFPYTEKEVVYQNGDVTLAATITIPEGDGPFPGAVLATGSGAQDRDETLMGHKPFWVLADHLARQGIAVLRADDRGVGGSSGDPAASTSADFATDALAGIRRLGEEAKVDAGKIGIIGHSEGGLIGPIAAAASKDVAYLVLLAGTGVSGEEILKLQLELITKRAGAGKAMLERALELQAEAIEIMKSDGPIEERKAALRKVIEQQLAGQGLSEEAKEQAIDANVNSSLSEWFQFFVRFDPREALRKVTVPVFALNGTLDLQVDPDQNLPAIEKALAEAGNEDVTVRRFEGLNHLFQHASTGLPAEYGQIEETLAPEVLLAVSSWIGDRFR